MGWGGGGGGKIDAIYLPMCPALLYGLHHKIVLRQHTVHGLRFSLGTSLGISTQPPFYGTYNEVRGWEGGGGTRRQLILCDDLRLVEDENVVSEFC